MQHLLQSWEHISKRKINRALLICKVLEKKTKCSYEHHLLFWLSLYRFYYRMCLAYLGVMRAAHIIFSFQQNVAKENPRPV